MKGIKDFEVKYVLSTVEQDSVVAGLISCNCTVNYGSQHIVVGALYIDGFRYDNTTVNIN